jgi:nucleoside-diphosphate-sugar epimerase
MKIALTGATGFVGRHVVTLLGSGKHAVTALVRNPALTNFPPKFHAVHGDLEDAAALDNLCNGVDVVIHLAGAVNSPKRDGYFAANESGTRNVAEAATRNKVKRFVHISTLSAREPQLSSYGASKNAAEEALKRFTNKMSVVILRPPAVYGPGDKATFPLLRALTQSIALIPGRADSRFSMIFVEDLARVVVAAAADQRTGIFELDDGRRNGYTWPDLVRIAAQTEYKNIHPLFLPRVVAMGAAAVVEVFAKAAGKPSMISVEKMRELYHEDWVATGEGWPLKAPTGFEQGFAMTVDWYRQSGWLPQTSSKHKTAS